MEPYLVVLLGTALTALTGYLGWLTSMAVKLSQTVAAIQSKQDSLVEEHNYLRSRVDSLVSAR